MTETTTDTTDAPATTISLEENRRAYQDRITDALKPLGRVHVTVMYDQDPPWYSDVHDAHERARNTGKRGMVILEHRRRGEPTEWLALTLLYPTIRSPIRCTGLPQLLATYRIQQARTQHQLPAKWRTTKNRARAKEATPVLVTAKHGTRSGTVLTPLHWHAQGRSVPNTCSVPEHPDTQVLQLLHDGLSLRAIARVMDRTPSTTWERAKRLQARGLLHNHLGTWTLTDAGEHHLKTHGGTE